MQKRTIINEIIKEREENYGELTTVLLEQFVPCLDAIELLFNELFCDFKWTDVNIDDENDILIISAVAKYSKPVIKVQTLNGEVEVPTVDIDGLPIQKELHIGIPMEMALKGSVKELYTFLVEMETRKDSPLFTALNAEDDIVTLDTDDSIFDEMYEEMEKNKTRILH